MTGDPFIIHLEHGSRTVCDSAHIILKHHLTKGELFNVLDLHMKKVSKRSAKCRGFRPGIPVSSHREGCHGGFG